MDIFREFCCSLLVCRTPQPPKLAGTVKANQRSFTFVSSSYMSRLWGNLQQKYSQLFWESSSLHSESLVAALLVSSSSSPSESHFVLFNGICNAPAAKCGIKNLHHFFIPVPVSFPMYIHHNACLKLALISLYLSLQVSPRPHLQARLPVLSSSSPSQIRDCGVSFHRFQNESDFHIATENQHLG